MYYANKPISARSDYDYMMNATKAQAKDRIKRVLDKIPELTSLSSDANVFVIWRRGTLHAISSVFGNDSRHFKDFRRISFEQRFFAQNYAPDTDFFQTGLDRAKTILETMLDEIEEYWSDDGSPQSQPGGSIISEQTVSNRVFVVHGRDDGTKNTVARFLERLDLEAIILHEQPSQSRTIIDKFEKYSQVDFAVILCTPDDVGKLNSEADELRPRPRQNVVLEWGFFLGMLGRERVCALLKGEVEIPSDYDGVLNIQMEGVEDWQTKLAIELRSAGMPVDLNRLARG